MRVLITGGDGFVAPYVIAALRAQAGSSCDILMSRHHAGPAIAGIETIVLDITDRGAVDTVVQKIGPTHLIHLAGVTSLSGASSSPDLAWTVNVIGTLNVARAISQHAKGCALLFASSSQIYGDTAKLSRALVESDVIAPMNDYAVTKAAADLALGAMAGEGLRCIRFRPFNHTGAGQTEDFVLPSFAGQIARIEAGQQPPIIKVGNLEAERDFLHVADVAEAYALGTIKAREVTPGDILNIASGQPRRIGDLLDIMVGKSRVSISIEQDAARMRPSETPVFVGDATRARTLLGWSPRRSVDTMIDDLLTYARAQTRGA